MRRLPIGKPVEVCQPDLDERAHGLLQANLLGDLQGFFIRLSHLLRRDALLQAVVAGHEELLDAFTRVGRLHVG